MAAAALRIANRARNGKNVAPLFGAETRGDQRPAAPRRLDHQRCQAEPADDAIALGEAFRGRRRTRWKLGNDQALLEDCGGEVAVARGINAIESGGGDGDSVTAGLQGAAMRRAVDAERKTAGNDETAGREFGGELGCSQGASRGAAPAADDRDLRLLEQSQLAAGVEQQRVVALLTNYQL